MDSLGKVKNTCARYFSFESRKPKQFSFSQNTKSSGGCSRLKPTNLKAIVQHSFFEYFRCAKHTAKRNRKFWPKNEAQKKAEELQNELNYYNLLRNNKSSTKLPVRKSD